MWQGINWSFINEESATMSWRSQSIHHYIFDFTELDVLIKKLDKRISNEIINALKCLTSLQSVQS